MLDTLATVVHADKLQHANNADNWLSKDELVDVLSNVPASKKRRKDCRSLLQEISKQHHTTKMNASDVIHLEENFSGTRLTAKLRKYAPSLFPSHREIMSQKNEYWREFHSLLLPERISTGWKVDPQKLLEILLFKYYWLEGVKHWKIYGDAREKGCQPSTFIGISVLNDEASLHGVKYHDPDEIFPIAIFYGKDSRDNLEENLGDPNSWLDEFIMKNQKENHFFLFKW